jgi:hypothetical protein
MRSASICCTLLCGVQKCQEKRPTITRIPVHRLEVFVRGLLLVQQRHLEQVAHLYSDILDMEKALQKDSKKT